MTDNRNHSTMNVFVYGEQAIDANFHIGTTHPNGGYGVLGIPGDVCDLTLFLHSREQAAAIAAAATEIAAQFPAPEPAAPCGDDRPHTEHGISAGGGYAGHCPGIPEPEQAHECGTPAAGTLDTADYPARMFVFQRDPDDPESWMFRCSEGHQFTDLARAGGWQSPDYASEDDALVAAADHARAMHDMGLPAALAERVTTAERRNAERHDSLIGRNVRRADDDSAVPTVGTITAITADPEFVVVTWLGPPPRFVPSAPSREAMDELTAAGGYWAVKPDAEHSSDGGFRYPVRHR